MLNGLWQHRRLTAEEASPLLQKPEAEARARLQALVEAGMVEARSGRPNHFHLAASVYRRLESSAAYVRQRGFDAIQQRQMILQLAKTDGRITRRQVAALCRVSSPQAYRLLQRLVQEGVLNKQGRRGQSVNYTLNARAH